MNTLGSQIKFVHSDAGRGAVTVSDAAIAAGVEAEDMDAQGILRAVLAVAALIAVIVIAVFQIVNLEVQDVRTEIAAASADAGALTDLRLAALQKLNRYEALPGVEGRYRIPIDRAIQQIAKEAHAGPATGYSSEVVLLRE